MVDPRTPLEPSTAVSELLSRPQLHLIAGERVASSDGGTFETPDPATGRALATVSSGSKDDVDRAVGAAREALGGPWADATAAQRGTAMLRLADLLERDADKLAELESLDNGKPMTVARRIDLRGCVEHLRYYAGWATKIEGEVIPVSTPRTLCYTRKEPVGVCAQIIPWNFPLLMAIWKIAPVLATGCTTVLKPAEETPLTALLLGELASESGIPPGVLNVVAGDAATGAALVDHPDIDKIAFTGSTTVGREIGGKAGSSLKRVTLELGGKSPNIVLADADLEAAVKGSFWAMYFNTGQACNAGSRLFVHEDRFEEVVEGVAALVRNTEPGPGLNPRTTIGPVVSARQQRRVERYIEAGREEGAELLAGGERLDRDGYFIAPTLFAAADEQTIAREEIFGPVLVALPFSSLDEVIGRANDSSYGLAAGIWTKDVGLAHRVAERLQAGSVYINQWASLDPAAPLGGFKASGIGREMGHAGLEPYLEHKTVWTGLG
jgi:acyl-CoA reductase-like NAD-dependent aldehyde dehydrogenase